MRRFSLDDVQAQAILDMRLKALQGLDREKLEHEYAELEERIAYYNSLLADPEKVKGVLKDELTALRDKYGDERKTEIQDVEDEIDIEDLIEEETCVFTLTHSGYIKRLAASEYRAQGRGGRGVKGMATREEDYVETVFTASTHDRIFFFTSFGRVYPRKGYQIPEAGRAARGTNIVNILPTDPGERVVCMLPEREGAKFLFLCTKNGTVKRMNLEVMRNIRKNGIRALNIDEDDELISACVTDGSCNILLATADGYAICFDENDARPMGRDAMGVRGIKLRGGDHVVGALPAAEGTQLLSITENGYGKRTAVSEYLRGGEDAGPQKRGGMGLKSYNVTEKTGCVADVRMVNGDEDVLIVADDGTIIRTNVSGISVLGRATQGVRIMRPNEGAKVISAALTDPEEDEESTENTESVENSPEIAEEQE